MKQTQKVSYKNKLNVAILIKRAVNLIKSNKFRPALNILLKAKAIDNCNAFIFYNLGLAYGALKDYPKAMRCYSKALFYDPALTDALICQGYIHGLRRNFKRELACYNKVLRRNPKDAIALYNKAIVLEEGLKDIKSAIMYHKRVLKLRLTKKQQCDVYIRLAYDYLDTRQYEKALDTLRKLIVIGRC